MDAATPVEARIVGTSPAFVRLLDAATRVADKDVTVLVRGETGTGKDLVARLLHERSHRRDRPFVIFNSAAIPRELAEAELFGYTRGAFTDALADHAGFFVQADGGTLFLDEIGEMSLDVQAKLLRVLQDGEVQPVGGAHVAAHRTVDVRVIAATHRDLLAEVRAGRFREDLYYRLDVVELVVPPLRERRDDIRPLARDFAQRYAERFGIGAVELTPDLLDHLEREPWPGNVRELENTVARLVALATSPTIGLDALAAHAAAAGAPDDLPSFREQVEAFERDLLRSALAAAHGNQSEAARRLHLGRASLYDKLKKYGLSK